MRHKAHDNDSGVWGGWCMDVCRPSCTASWACNTQVRPAKEGWGVGQREGGEDVNQVHWKVMGLWAEQRAGGWE